MRTVIIALFIFISIIVIGHYLIYWEFHKPYVEQEVYDREIWTRVWNNNEIIWYSTMPITASDSAQRSEFKKAESILNLNKKLSDK